MNGPPPRSPLFPHTPLFQSLTRADPSAVISADMLPAEIGEILPSRPAQGAVHIMSLPLREARRSEEHTSELQSRQYLVCRLLLEKKNRIRRSLDVFALFSAF